MKKNKKYEELFIRKNDNIFNWDTYDIYSSKQIGRLTGFTCPITANQWIEQYCL